MTTSSRNLIDSLDHMILSASGWRKIFAPDGGHGHGTLPSDTDRLLAVGMGIAWGERLNTVLGKDRAAVLIATDTRPTGSALSEMIMRGLLSTGCLVRPAGVAAAPEAMAHSAMDNSIDAFAYISASHNPLGHNGVKFGISGGVIGGTDAGELIDSYKKLINSNDVAARLSQTAEDFNRELQAAMKGMDEEKQKALAGYESLLNQIAGGPGDTKSRQKTLSALKDALKKNPLTVVADLNGSARCVSADRAYLEGLGVTLSTFNDTPGEVVHAILPEGESLEPCRKALEEAHSKNSGAVLGFVPDNDGDRGNLVIWDDALNGARILEAQEVFALSTLAEFAADSWARRGESIKSAVAVNGPTSLRIRRIAAAYAAEVHEAEVGEANVVGRAAELRRDGFQVRLLGEGSNGGTITHPAAVRDPLNTLTALIKLLRLPESDGAPAPFADWCRRTGKDISSGSTFGCADIIGSLPVFTTTPASAPRALMQISSKDQGLLKRHWEEIFAEQWKIHSEKLAEMYNFASWREVNNEGTASRTGVGPEMRSGKMTGGLKVIFSNPEGEDVGYVWMRGSGTEPVFRIMTEIQGNRPDAEAALTAWHRSMVAQADHLACSKKETLPIEEPF